MQSPWFLAEDKVNSQIFMNNIGMKRKIQMKYSFLRFQRIWRPQDALFAWIREKILCFIHVDMNVSAIHVGRHL
jgi:hypothetical protein